MNPLLLQQLERIAEHGIQLLSIPQITTHFVFERDGFAVLVERTAEGFGQIGSPGLLNQNGFHALVERGGHTLFVSKNVELPAPPEETRGARRLLADLRQALGQ